MELMNKNIISFAWDMHAHQKPNQNKPNQAELQCIKRCTLYKIIVSSDREHSKFNDILFKHPINLWKVYFSLYVCSFRCCCRLSAVAFMWVWFALDEAKVGESMFNAVHQRFIEFVKSVFNTYALLGRQNAHIWKIKCRSCYTIRTRLEIWSAK